MEKKFDTTKPVQTRDGRKARIICTDRFYPGYPIVALIDDVHFGRETLKAYSPDGIVLYEPYSGMDLINIPEKVTVYLNVYLDTDPRIGCGYAYTTEKQARENADGAGAAVIAVPITIEI